MGHLDFFSCEAYYDASNTKEVLGTDVTRNVQYGMFFPVQILNKRFHIELLYIHWENDLIELHPKVITGAESIQTLHGRMRLSAKIIEKGRYRGKRVLTLRQGLLKKGITLHSNLCMATIDQLDEGSGIDTEVTLSSMGAIAIGTKEELLYQNDNRRNELCVIFNEKDVEVPISAFVISRVLPIYHKKFFR